MCVAAPGGSDVTEERGHRLEQQSSARERRETAATATDQQAAGKWTFGGGGVVIAWISSEWLETDYIPIDGSFKEFCVASNFWGKQMKYVYYAYLREL